MMRFQIFLLALSFIVCGVTPAYACRGASLETRTYLSEVSETAHKEDVVGKVEVLSTVVRSGGDDVLSLVKVVEAVKGLREGQMFIVVSEVSHSCNRDPELAIGATHYIAGKFNAEHHFHGVWKLGEVHYD